MIDPSTFLVEQIPVVEYVPTLEIPYYPVEILVATVIITHLVIIMPTPFSYKSTKVVPWKYNSTLYLYGLKQEEKPLEVQKPAQVQKSAKVQEPAVNITGTGGMTRSGCIFASVPPPLETDDL